MDPIQYFYKKEGSCHSYYSIRLNTQKDYHFFLYFSKYNFTDFILMNKLRATIQIISFIAIPLAIYLLYLQFTKKEPIETVVTNNMVVEKIESIGKLELCKYFIKDVVEQKEVKDWYLPNSKVIVIISGEVTGCIDLKKIDSNSVSILTDKIRIKLPAPEICYVKINHQESKVYDIKNEFFDKAKLIDKAYSLAEKNILDGAIKMKIYDQTKSNAQITLKPLLEGFTGKTVELYF
jgi:hypothetical protein